jgi:hypothetical protein
MEENFCGFVKVMLLFRTAIELDHHEAVSCSMRGYLRQAISLRRPYHAA